MSNDYQFHQRCWRAISIALKQSQTEISNGLFLVPLSLKGISLLDKLTNFFATSSGLKPKFAIMNAPNNTI